MTPYEHYLRADELLEQADAQRERLNASMNAGPVGYAEGELAVSRVALAYAAAQAHATLATAAE